MSLVEILVSIVLLGTAGVSMLAAVASTVTGTRVGRDQSQAQVWLRSAADELQMAERHGCDQGEPAVRAAYLEHIRANVENPVGWEDAQLTIRTPVKAWDGERYLDPSAPATLNACYDAAGFQLQMITIVVTSLDGETLEEISVVKG